MEKRRKKHKSPQKSKKKVILLSILALLIFIIGFAGVYAWRVLGSIKTAEISKDNESVGINQETADKLDKQNDILNIAFFGVDQRDKSENGRSDSTMVLSIDRKHNKIKMTSIMRDSYVNIEGHGKDKLNHAYSFGGPQLAIKTLNQNYELNIRDFVAVNFGDLAKIIDELGGVQIDIKSNEVSLVNEYINDVVSVTGLKGTPLKGAGTQTLSGVQAVAYSRIRYVGNGDFERTERQRTVLTALFNKIKTAGPSEYPSLVNKLMPYVQTSMNPLDIIKIGTSALTNGITNLEQERFPVDGYCNGATINGVWYLQFDEQATKEQIYKYIYEDIKPTPGTPKF